MNKLKWAALLFWGAFALQARPARADIPLIEVRVEITEVDETKASRLGVDWGEKFTFQEDQPAGVVSVGSVERLTQLRADLHLLQEEGAAKILARPNLVTDHGATAVFHAGGEIPYVTSTSLGGTNVEFKPYGVSLKVKPRVKKPGRVTMEVSAGVSAPDQTNGVTLTGTSVPALRQRDVKSTVTVRDGSTLVLAGLVQNIEEKSERGIPLLRRIPFLGRLFRWERTLARATSIVIFVTPNQITNN